MLAGIAILIDCVFESPFSSMYSLTALPRHAVIISLIVIFRVFEAALIFGKGMSEDVAQSFLPESCLFPSCNGFKSCLVNKRLKMTFGMRKGTLSLSKNFSIVVILRGNGIKADMSYVSPYPTWKLMMLIPSQRQ